MVKWFIKNERKVWGQRGFLLFLRVVLQELATIPVKIIKGLFPLVLRMNWEQIVHKFHTYSLSFSMFVIHAFDGKHLHMFALENQN